MIPSTQNDPERGRRLAGKRKELGLNQREMAAKIDVNRNSITQWEQGKLPQAANIEKAVEGYELGEDFFFSSASAFEEKILAELADINRKLDRLLPHIPRGGEQDE